MSTDTSPDLAPGHGTDDPDLGGEVTLGSALFTLVEPHRGHEVAYNRWYERDHFYAGCMVGPWFFAGRRWVATRDLKDMRIGAADGPEGAAPLFGDDRAGSYLALYWVLKGRFRENVDWSSRQVHWLHRHGRMFPERDHIHTLLYRYRGAVTRDADGVPPELALDHPFAGLGAVVVERSNDVAPPRPPLEEGSPVSLVLAFAGVPLPPGAPVSQPGTEGVENREMQLWFADAPPGEWWDEVRAYAESLQAAGDGVVRWASPFVPTVPGTDRYTDELW
ncbi:MAG TPA: hypothetical protein VF743_00095 [Acidimicrobiales bacterium]